MQERTSHRDCNLFEYALLVIDTIADFEKVIRRHPSQTSSSLMMLLQLHNVSQDLSQDQTIHI